MRAPHGDVLPAALHLGALGIVDARDELHLASAEFGGGYRGVAPAVLHLYAQGYVHEAAAVGHPVGYHLGEGSAPGPAYAGSAAPRRLQRKHLLPVPEGYAAEAEGPAGQVLVAPGTLLALLLPGGIPQILQQLHAGAALGIEVDGAAVVEIYPQREMRVLDRRPVVAHEAVLHGLRGDYLGHLHAVGPPEQAHVGLRPEGAGADQRRGGCGGVFEHLAHILPQSYYFAVVLQSGRRET